MYRHQYHRNRLYKSSRSYGILNSLPARYHPFTSTQVSSTIHIPVLKHSNLTLDLLKEEDTKNQQNLTMKLSTIVTILFTFVASSAASRLCQQKQDKSGHSWNLFCSRPGISDNGALNTLCCNSFGCDNGKGKANFGGHNDPGSQNGCNCDCTDI